MHQHGSHEPMAVVGIGCRFPGGANSAEQFWRLLVDGVDAITEIPANRFDLGALYDADPSRPGKLYSRWGGFADHVDAFDAEFFGISPREAIRIDPQQRMLLEVVWEALEDGGIAADRLAGSRTGVFVGISTHDYYDLQVNPENRHRLDSHSSTGTATSIAANRISYSYDFRGPSFIVDTACSSSLTAVHLACRSLRAGECDLAVAAGVNAFLTPEVAIGFCKASMLSPDGRCKAFDARANGFVRGEGAGVVILKPLSRAVADRDRIYALVRGSAVNQDGRTVGIAVPSAEAQATLIGEALRDAGVVPDAVRYVEAHGTGTKVGDPIEASAIGRALSARGSRPEPCLIGSAKTNIGHLEAAAGIAGLIKASLVLQRRAVPPTLHLTTPNPAIPLRELGLSVVTALTPLATNGTPALAGVNSFGFGGANAHVVLEEPPPPPHASPTPESGAHILPISARHPDALRALVDRYRDGLAQPSVPQLADLCHSASVRRSHHPYRVAVVGATAEELRDQLEAVLAEPTLGGGPHRPPKIAFVFTGMGPQWWGMGRGLLATETRYREAIEECHHRFGAIAPWSLLDALTADEATSRVGAADLAAATNFAVQMGLTELLTRWGIVPDAIVGHSAGELAAACAAGVLTIDDGLLLAYHRGRLQHRATGTGTMLSVGIGDEAARRLIAPVADRVSIAAINSSTSVTLSGDRSALERIATALTAERRLTRFLTVDVPYHGPQMEAIRAEFLSAIASVAPRVPTTPMVSTVTGRWVDGPLDAPYWYDNIREPVRFRDAVDRLIDDDIDVFLEIGPHPVLAVSLNECLATRGRAGATLPTLRRKDDDRRVLLKSVAALYCRGSRPDWSQIEREGHLAPLPQYPWQRERLWFESESTTVRTAGVDSGHPLLGHQLRSVRPTWETPLAGSALDYLTDHVVQGSPVYPAAAYLEMALAAGRSMTPDARPVLEDVTFKKVLFLTDRKASVLQTGYDARTGGFEIHSGQGDGGWTLNAAGTLRNRATPPANSAVDLAAIRSRCPIEVPAEDVYRALERQGLRYQGLFRGIDRLWRGPGEALAAIALPAGATTSEPYLVHPALLDSALQSLLAAGWPVGADTRAVGLFLPVAIRRLSYSTEAVGPCWAHARIVRADADTVEGDITITDDTGRVVTAIRGLRCQSLTDARGRQAALSDLTYRLQWEAEPLDTPTAAAGGVTPSRELGPLLQPAAERLADEQGWADPLRRAEPMLDAIVAHFTRAALTSLGWDGSDAGDREAIAARFRIVPRQRRFFGRLLDIVRTIPTAGPLPSPDEDRHTARRLCRELLADFPAGEPLLELLGRSGDRLDAILSGTVDPVEVLFAPATASAWARFFAELPWYRFYNELAADAIAAAVEQLPHSRRLRVLEVGAGTAGTTIAVLPRLEGRSFEYHFTDVSPAFLAQARDRFRHQPGIKIAALDLEADPIAQMGPEPFDIILAANVVHATADLATSLEHVRQLLRPGGLFVLLEVTRKMAWTDLIFGVTEGWWRFTDTEVRPDYALLGPTRWGTVLRAAGFEEPVVVAERHEPGDPLQMVMLTSRPAADPVAEASSRNWLVFADETGVSERIAAGLRARGDRVAMVRPGHGFATVDDASLTMGAASRADAERLVDHLADAGWAPSGVIHAWSLDAASRGGFSGPEAVAAQDLTCGSVLALLQACDRRGRGLPPMWLVTAGAQAVDPNEGADVMQAPLWGFGRVLTSEQPGLHCRLVDLGTDPGADEIDAFLAELDGNDDEEEIAYRDGRRFVTRLRRIELAETAATPEPVPLEPDQSTFRLEVGTPGVLESLTLRELAGRQPGRGDIEIRVRAAGLNFRDVMLALGLLPPMTDPNSDGRTILGFECAGTVVACGPDVTEFQPGDEVMAIAFGAFSSRVVTPAAMAARKPSHLSFEQAATIPLVFVTAHYGLNRLGHLAAGERVLIHAATGGVGLAAIQLARRAGAVIFATAGNPDKRAYLHALGIEHVMDSRTVAFADEILTVTNGEGVDVVLNSLAGEAITKGLSILRPYGRFLEMGKRDILADQAIGLLPFDRNLAFCSIALERMCVDRPELVGAMLREIAEGLTDGTLEPIPHTAVPLAQAEEAFRTLAQAKHIGKLVLTVTEAEYRVAPYHRASACRADATYVVSGGFGGFGLEVARWLVDRGARHLVLIGRSGQPTAANAAAYEALGRSGAVVMAVAADLSDPDQTEQALARIRAAHPPIAGVVHAAMVLEDAPLALLGPDRFRTVLAPKVAGAWNLHLATRTDPLEFFVMFSSIASVLGTKGQGAYAAANLFLDALAPHRRAEGRPALTVNWGALSDVGYLAQHQDVAHHLHRHGMDSFTPAEALAVLDLALRHDVTQLMAARLDWDRWAAVDADASVVKRTRRLAHFATDANPLETAGPRGGLLPLLTDATGSERLELLARHLIERIAKVLGTAPARVPADRPLTDLGIDSLMAVELQTVVDKDLGTGLPLAALLGGSTVRQLAATLLEQLALDAPADDLAQDLEEVPVSAERD